MGERKHTPGPWHIAGAPWDSSKETFGVYSGVLKTDPRTGNSRYVGTQQVLPFFDCDFGQGMHAQRHKADAHLIAAAPELLEALTAIIRQIDQGGSGGKVFSRDACIATARSIIAKATGEAVRGLDVLA